MWANSKGSAWFASGLAAVLLGSAAIFCGCTGDEPAIDDAVSAVDRRDQTKDGGDSDDPAGDISNDGQPGLPGEPIDGDDRADGDATPDAPPPPVEEPAFGDDAPGGNHAGERRQLEVDIAFSGQVGETVTDADGIHYYVWGITMHEDKVYPSAYWGTYPLYIFGMKVGVTVTVRNNGPRMKTRLIVRTEACVLRVDGTSGVALAEPRDIEIEVARDQTVTIDASFTAEYVAGAESGLDRFVVKVLHPNQGGGPGNEEPALVMMKEGVLCPPEPLDGAGTDGEF